MSSDPRLSLPVWDALTSAEREDAALALAGCLPAPFTFKGLKTYSLADQTHEVAAFGWKRSTFLLIPGAAAVLGFDKNASGFPNAAQQESWRPMKALLRLGLNEFLRNAMTAPRTAVMKPFLMEASPTVLPEVTSWHQVKGRVEKTGFALPTPDQWEYACAAGSRTFFRWGDACPLDVRPTDKSAWTLHRQPNAFGLRLPSDSNTWELTSERGIMRGGNGWRWGYVGGIADWLPLSTAFTVAGEDKYEVICHASLRRVFLLT